MTILGAFNQTQFERVMDIMDKRLETFKAHTMYVWQLILTIAGTQKPHAGNRSIVSTDMKKTKTGFNAGNAMPAKDRKHIGKHSYTVMRGAAKVEVLLKNRAYYVRCPEDQKGQVSWQKNGDARNAWIVACGRAGVLPWVGF